MEWGLYFSQLPAAQQEFLFFEPISRHIKNISRQTYKVH